MTTAGILSIGTEILRGYTQDTNANYLAKFFRSLGIKAAKFCTADDEMDSILEGLNHLSDCDIIVTTGGLGPTADDITRNAVAKFCTRKLIRQQSLVEQLKKYFANHGLQISPSNWQQADIPEGASVIDNNNGTAAGFYLKTADKPLIIVLPGPPKENIPMINTFLPDILRKNGCLSGHLHNKIYKIYDIGESTLADLVKQIDFGSNIVGYYFTTGGWCELHISKFTDNPSDELDGRLLSQVESLFTKSGYFWTDDRPLSEILFEALSDKQYTISFAESLTGGGLSADFTKLAGVSAVHKGGVVSYTNEIKRDILGVKQSTLDTFTEVSEETAREMATGVQKLFRTNAAVSLTGIAGPSGGTEQNPVGTVCFGYAVNDKVITQKTHFTGDRLRVINKAINNAYINIIKMIKN